MPAAPEGLACKSCETRKLQSPTGQPDIRLSLHSGLTAYSVLSSVVHCATVTAANALRLVDRSADFDFAAASTPALSVRTTRLHRTPTLRSAVTTTSHRLQRTSK